MENSLVDIKYYNKGKNETTERKVFVTKIFKKEKGSLLGFDVTSLPEEEIIILTESYNAYQKKYYNNIPSFEEYLETENISVEPRWRRFLKERTDIK